MVVKINVSISKAVLEKLDEAARDTKTSRSAFLTRAVEHYIQEKEEEKELERRRRAADRITRIAEKIGPWDATAEVLKWRDRH
ncbi:MAG: ribbon-helix-helix protein, CopG family [Chloroflexi bacterium]|nr:ribbon-helix-helix protein, CopG family [Chloroflexota bacterium]